jgi:cytochrome c553
MNLRHYFVTAVIVFSLFSFGCSKKEGSESASSSQSQKAAAPKVDPRAQFDQMFTKPELVKMGENIYQTKGMQTCLQCHRAGGEGEGFAGAAKLVAPNTFRSFNALGGYDALAKNPKEFREKFETSLLYLIHGGGLNFNQNFSKDHPEIVYDWSKTGKTQYDMMMWGVAQAEMKTKVKKVHEELTAAGKTLSESDMQWLAAYAALEYIKSFEKPGKLANGKPAPKIWE